MIPVFKTAAFLPECLDSVLNQTLRDIEIVVVVDGSPDNSLDIVRQYEQKDSRIKVISKPINEGLTRARNSGVAASTGQWLIHLDSDDFWLDDNMLLELYQIASLEGCDILRFNGREYYEGQLGKQLTANLDLINGNFCQDRELRCYRSVFLYLFRKDFIDRHGLAFEPTITLGEDGVFLSSALPKAKRVSSTSKLYYAYRIRLCGMMKTGWTLEDFMEENRATQMIADNLSKVDRSALHDYLFYRLHVYWVKVMSAKVVRDLSKPERETLFRATGETFSRLTVNTLWIRPSLFAGRLLYRQFVKSDFRGFDRSVRAIRLLVLLLPPLTRCRQKLMSLRWRFLKASRTITGSVAGFLWTAFGKARAFSNIESLEDLNFILPKERPHVGVSAMLRVKNEERRIEACIRSIIDVFDEIVVVDNGSEDTTLERIRSLCVDQPFAKKVKIFEYRQPISRCGPEHAATPELSVSSLAYYYNWCLAKCRYTSACKWDADMVLSSTPEARARFAAFISNFGKKNFVSQGVFPVRTVYLDSESKAYEAQDEEVHREVRIFPNSSLSYFRKDALWEVLETAISVPKIFLPEVCVYELKDVADDEFSHWSTSSFKGARKVREYRNYVAVKNHLHKDHGFVEVEAL